MWLQGDGMNRTAKIFLWVGLALVLAAVVGMSAYQVFWKARPLKIGFVATLSGYNSELGVSGREGATIAVSEINREGGILNRKLELVAEDDEGDPEVAIALDSRLYDDGIRFFIGHMTSQVMTKLTPFIHKPEILMVSPTISSDAFSRSDDSFVRVMPTNTTQPVALAEQMLVDKVNSVVAFVDGSNLAYSQGVYDQFKKYYEAVGGQILEVQQFEIPDRISLSLIEHITSGRADGVLVLAGAGTSSHISQQLYQQNLHPKMYFPVWAMTQDLLSHGGQSIEGATLINYYDNQSTTGQYLDFVQQYRDTYGGEPSFGAVHAYEAVMVLAEAIKRSESFKPRLVKKEIISQTFSGLSGPIQFDAFGDVERDLVIYEIKDGQYQSVGRRTR